MEALQGHVVRAVDVGYGNVKFSLQHPHASQQVMCGIFPSRSPAATSSEQTLAAGAMQARDTVSIKIRKNTYEVGYGVTHAEGAFDETAVLDKGFCLSDAYMARLLGAVYYQMGGPRDNRADVGPKFFEGSTISLLVLGLPVSTYREPDLRDKLRAAVVGTHELPDDRTVNIRNVQVIPQPMGAFYEYAFQNNMFDRMSTQHNLVIDPGFFTFDWLMTDGLTPLDGRSNAVYRGMSAVMKAIAESIKRQESLGTDISTLTRLLDNHFRTGRPFFVGQKQIDVGPHIAAGHPVIYEAVSALGNLVGDGSDIQNIIVGGGAAHMYLDAIREKFPAHKVVVTGAPVFSNVRGFQLFGEQQVIGQLHAARKRTTA